MVKSNIVHTLDVLKFLERLKGESLFDLIIIDPPYNIGQDFGNNQDHLSINDYVDWSLKYLKECFRLIKPSVPIYVYGYPEILAHIAIHYPISHQRWLVWHYTNKTVPSSRFWQRSHESLLCLWKDDKPKLMVDRIREDYTENFLKNAAGKVRKSKDCRYSKGRSQTIYQAHQNGALPRDVIKIPALAGGSGVERVSYCKSCNKIVLGQERHQHTDCETIRHPTQKPTKLTEKLIKGSNPHNLLIPFAGTGSECVVAKKHGVTFYATEINPEYVNMANQWIQTIWI